MIKGGSPSVRDNRISGSSKVKLGLKNGCSVHLISSRPLLAVSAASAGPAPAVDLRRAGRGERAARSRPRRSRPALHTGIGLASEKIPKLLRTAFGLELRNRCNQRRPSRHDQRSQVTTAGRIRIPRVTLVASSEGQQRRPAPIVTTVASTPSSCSRASWTPPATATSICLAPAPALLAT